MLDVRRRVWHRGERARESIPGANYNRVVVSVSHPLLTLPYPCVPPPSFRLSVARLSTIRKKKKKRERGREISGIDISEFFLFLSFFFSKFVSTNGRSEILRYELSKVRVPGYGQDGSTSAQP